MFNRRILKYLSKWKNHPRRKPLILRGARQVGKTSAVRLFAEKNYTKFVQLNLEQVVEREFYSRVKSVDQFIQSVRVDKGTNITPENTLIFIDEIQNCPNLLEMLRFFYEDYPDLHVIAAGSLLEKIIEKEKPSIPVGRVSYAYMYPLDFFEYLEAISETKLLSVLKQISMPDAIPENINKRALEHFQDYLLIGGLPEVVAQYVESPDIVSINEIFSQILTSYADDILKYASDREVKYIDHVLLNAHSTAGKIYKYSNFAGTRYSNKEMEPAFRSLEKVMFLTQVPATKSTRLPIISQLHRPKKLIHLDVGLVNFQSNIQHHILKTQRFEDMFHGRVVEQVVGQNIIAQGETQTIPLNYWSIEKSISSAEVDFCIVHKSEIVGIEVKSGATGKLRSLFVFSDQVQDNRLVRFHTGHLMKEEQKLNKRNYKIFSIPVYLTPRLFEMLDSFSF